ncbi:trace amine-associated receptor 9-like [Asterias amurensis]|uniref:trace amine-associated receptor 9-like n=1 Tax=Asterias amurensis TaxID=7602 RepID=UPI003AB745AD
MIDVYGNSLSVNETLFMLHRSSLDTMDDTVMQVLGAFSAVIGILGVLGNFVVCVAICRVPDMHTVTNAILCNQAVADLLGSVVLMLFFNIPSSETLPDGFSGWLYCYLWKSESILWMFLLTSAISLMLVTLERYLAIVYPFKYQALLACWWVPGIAITITWIFGVGLSLLIFGLITYSEEEKTCIVSLPPTSKNPLNPFVQATNIISFIAPAWTMLFAYIHISVVLKRSARQTDPVPMSTTESHLHTGAGSSNSTQTNQETKEESLLRARRNVIKTLILVCVAYFICWLPNTITLAANLSGIPYDIATVFAAANSSINPLIYAIKYKRFRDALKTLFGRKSQRIIDYQDNHQRIESLRTITATPTCTP